MPLGAQMDVRVGQYPNSHTVKSYPYIFYQVTSCYHDKVKNHIVGLGGAAKMNHVLYIVGLVLYRSEAE